MLLPFGGVAIDVHRRQLGVLEVGALAAHHQAERVRAVLDGVVPEVEQRADRLGAAPRAAEQDDVGRAGDEVPLPLGRHDADLDRHVTASALAAPIRLRTGSGLSPCPVPEPVGGPRPRSAGDR